MILINLKVIKILKTSFVFTLPFSIYSAISLDQNFHLVSGLLYGLCLLTVNHLSFQLFEKNLYIIFLLQSCCQRM